MTKKPLAIKLYIPKPAGNAINRPRLVERLNRGLENKLILVSSSAGSGKTTLLAQWIQQAPLEVAMISLDDNDNDPVQFLSYFISSIQKIKSGFGQKFLEAIHNPQPPSASSVMSALINEINGLKKKFALVLDDYHVIESKSIDQLVGFLIDYLPENMRLLIATREDPLLPIARFRTKGHLTELRVPDLSFSTAEISEFFNNSMRLNLSSDDILALEKKTEGWIAGIQLAAISLQEHKNIPDFIRTFTGSHHYVLDYLLEEVLLRQPEEIQKFLLHTSVLSRLSGPLCDNLVPELSRPSREILMHLVKSNLFLIPLDNERQWFRYHHLFADLLRQKLDKSEQTENKNIVHDLYHRASEWCEQNGHDIDAFQYATHCDNNRAAMLVREDGIPIYIRGAIVPVLNWLNSISRKEKDENPLLWLIHAKALISSGQTSQVDDKLAAAEAAIQNMEGDEFTKNIRGGIALTKSILEATRYHPLETIRQAKTALQYLSEKNSLSILSATFWMGVGYLHNGDRREAREAYNTSLSMSQKAEYNYMIAMSKMGLAEVEEYDLRLHQAEKLYKKSLDYFGDRPVPIASVVHLGLARIYYEWNDIGNALKHTQISDQMARLYEEVLDRYVYSEIMLARIQLCQGNIVEAIRSLESTLDTIRRNNFEARMSDIHIALVDAYLRHGNIKAARELISAQDLPFSLARILLAEDEPDQALEILDMLDKQAQERNWEAEKIKICIQQALCFDKLGDNKNSTDGLIKCLKAGQTASMVRLFIDAGNPMMKLLQSLNDKTLTQSLTTGLYNYIKKLLFAFKQEKSKRGSSLGIDMHNSSSHEPLIEPLSAREMGILQLIAQGLSNQDISERLSLTLNTVKSHNQNIFGKLGVERRTEAVARARQLNLLKL